jgi:hypothetical protein
VIRLNVDGCLALANGGFIYVTEKDEEENILIRKYHDYFAV